MKKLRGPLFDNNRVPLGVAMLRANLLTEAQAMGDDYNGCFVYKNPALVGPVLRVIAGRGHGWDHVSVSLAERCPIWAEMEWVKRRFFKEDEVAFQLHVPPKDHISVHPYTLHLWRPLNERIPMPPSYMV